MSLGQQLASIINDTVRRIIGAHFLPRVRQPMNDNEPKAAA